MDRLYSLIASQAAENVYYTIDCPINPYFPCLYVEFALYCLFRPAGGIELDCPCETTRIVGSALDCPELLQARPDNALEISITKVGARERKL